MQANPNRYIYPPRPATTVPPTALAEFSNLYPWAQLKYNGARCLLKHLPAQGDEPARLQLWNRHGQRFKTYTPPDHLLAQIHNFIHALGLPPTGYHLFDGELIDFKHRSIRDTLAIWDLLVRNDTHLIGTTYQERYQLLQAPTQQLTYYHHNEPMGNFLPGSPDLIIPLNYPSPRWAEAWELIGRINAPYTQPLIEGLVLKQPEGKLSHGFNANNNGDWMLRSRLHTARHIC